MILKIKAFNINANDRVRDMYGNHKHFHEGDAGIDLYCLSSSSIMGNSTGQIHLGIACEMIEEKQVFEENGGKSKMVQKSYNKPYWLVPRSSIVKTPLRMANSIGLIDSGYRGEIIATVDNTSDKQYIIERGTRLFQIVSMTGEPLSIQVVDSLSDTSRGSGGFGSTGTKKMPKIRSGI